MKRRIGTVAPAPAHSPLIKILLAAAISSFVALPSGCAPAAPRITYTYTVGTIGSVHTNPAVLAKLAKAVYADRRGWSLGGRVAFKQVLYGGDFTLWLASPDQLPRLSSICSPIYSCSVGRNVIINEARFDGGPPSFRWPGTLTSYQTMVINHETGHWLGLGHRYCSGPGAIAPVMQQQSISLQGCNANSWPTAPELATVASARHL
jgi:hypothetical protein